MTVVPYWLKHHHDFWIILIKKRGWLKYLGHLAAALAVFGLIAGGYGFYFFYFKTDDLPSIKRLAELKLNRSSYVYASNREITGRFFYQNRDLVRYQEIPDTLKHAVLAAEDKRFFKHFGIDPLAISRAFVGNRFVHHRVTSGASTITQQLVRLLYEDEVPEFQRREMTLRRKIKEVRLAIQLEKKYSKEEILAAYLNYIYLGHGRFGVVEAARYYFSKELSELTVAEAAMLVAMNKFPARFCPIDKPKVALERRNWILGLMRDAQFIGQEELVKQTQEPIKLKAAPVDSSFGYALDFVRRQLLTQGYSPRAIWHEGGLRVYTTLDGRIQKLVSQLLHDHLAQLNAQFGQGVPLEGAAVVIANQSGRIAAVSGGHDWLETKYNRAVQKSAARQAGSAFKIFTYAEAFKQGFDFEDKICDCPFRLPGKISFRGKVLQWWAPQNFHEESHPNFMGPIPLWQGLVLSRNVATLQLARRLGLKNILETAQAMGIKSELSPYLPTVIGASDVGLLELTAAYSVLANEGIFFEPYLVEKIQNPAEKILYQNQTASQSVLPREVTEKMTVLLRAVTEVGTAKITFRGATQKVAGKTGTTNDSRDVWFIGFTPGLRGYTVGTRLGYDLPQSLGEKQTGGLLAAPLVRKIVEGIYQRQPQDNFDSVIEEKLTELIRP